MRQPHDHAGPGAVQCTGGIVGAEARRWSFADGSHSTGHDPSHTYTPAGNFLVTDTASDEAGSDTATRTMSCTEHRRQRLRCRQHRQPARARCRVHGAGLWLSCRRVFYPPNTVSGRPAPPASGPCGSGRHRRHAGSRDQPELLFGGAAAATQQRRREVVRHLAAPAGCATVRVGERSG
jgi:PKD repeat protein